MNRDWHDLAGEFLCFLIALAVIIGPAACSNFEEEKRIPIERVTGKVTEKAIYYNAMCPVVFLDKRPYTCKNLNDYGTFEVGFRYTIETDPLIENRDGYKTINTIERE